MRALPLLALTAALAVALSACRGGSDSPAAEQQLGERDFTNKVAAAIITRSDLQAEPEVALLLNVRGPNGLDTISLKLDDAYSRYQAAPARQSAIVDGVVQDVDQQMEAGNSKRSLGEVRDELMPLLKRTNAVDTAGGGLAFRRFHDLDVVYGVQRENSFTAVTNGDLEHWGLSVGELDARAFANLERQTNKSQMLRCEPSGNQKLCGWASGDGYDATRMLVPGLRRQIVHELGGPAVYAVPLESVFVALTRNYAQVIRAKVLQEFTTGKNPLSPDLFVERNGRLVVLPK